jgi:hypothetical protein
MAILRSACYRCSQTVETSISNNFATGKKEGAIWHPQPPEPNYTFSKKDGGHLVNRRVPH